MNLNKTINKKILEDIISKTFSNFGLIISSNLLDSLKLFGFHYATNSGISINIEDLRTPELKDFYIKEINNDIKFISHNWFEGNISYNERFYSIIDRWTITSETLKEKIVNYYKTFDPVNNLFIMAFSGARGNISQMHQLVGMRGLMSDQFGNVIDLPIQSNFREGLNLVDYIVSAYGARKGIVDTALKTADSGYLTRRLVYLAQDLIIRELDCGSKKGIILLITKEDSFKHLIGQKILNIQNYNYPFSKKSFKNLELNSNNLEMFKNESPLFVTIRSIITCISNGSLCQNCYGLNLSKQKQIELGSTVGIIAAQSIGEPGTQLTMRTFHTGGTFKSTSFSFLDMPASGIMQLLTFSGTKFIRTKYGDKSLKLNQNIFITLTNWKGNKINIQIKSNVLLNLFKTGFIYKNQRIGEILETTLIIKQRKIDPFYIKTSGKIISNIFKKNKEFLLNPYKLSVIPGYLGLIPIENKLIYSNIIDNNKTISVIKIISPINGIINIKDNFFILQKNNKNYYIDINELIKLVFDLKNKNFLIKLIPTFKNYQYIDNFSVIGFIYFFIKIEKKEKLFSLNKLKDQFKDLVFISTDNYHFKSYGFSEVNKKNKSKEISIVNQNNLKIKFNNLGLCIKQNKCNQIFNYIEGIHLGINSAISINKKNFYVFKNDLLGFSTIYSQHNNDIIQGLPKIEELIEARNVKNPAIIFKFSSTILQINSFKNNFFIFKKIIKNNINYSYNKNYKIINNPKKNLNNCILIKESLPNNNFFYYNNKLFKIKYFLTNLKFNNSNQIIKGNELINLKILNENLKWKKIKQKNNKLIEILFSFLYQNKNKNIISFLNKKKNNYLIYKTIIENNSSNYIINLNKNLYIFLENIKKETNSILLKKNIKLIVKEGDFIDIGEPISEGLIDSHSLLDSLFKYHLKNDGAIDGTLNSLIKFQLILSNSIQSIYFSQDVNVSQKHIEILAIQMLSKVIIQRRGDTPFFENELIPVFILLEILKILTFDNNIYKVPSFDLKLLSATSYSLNKDSFLSAAGFQETRRILIRAAIHGDIDWLRGLKETLITGKILPIGSTFLNFKNYLDNLYTFKE